MSNSILQNQLRKLQDGMLIYTKVEAEDSLMYCNANPTRCFESGGLKRACSILSSKGSATRNKAIEYSKKQTSAKYKYKWLDVYQIRINMEKNKRNTSGKIIQWQRFSIFCYRNHFPVECFHMQVAKTRRF